MNLSVFIAPCTMFIMCTLNDNVLSIIVPKPKIYTKAFLRVYR